MIRLLAGEVADALESREGDEVCDEISLATGVLAYDYMKKHVEAFNARYPNRRVHLYRIENRFFGEMITVAGLITGQDLKEPACGKESGPPSAAAGGDVQKRRGGILRRYDPRGASKCFTSAGGYCKIKRIMILIEAFLHAEEGESTLQPHTS